MSLILQKVRIGWPAWVVSDRAGGVSL